MSIARATLLSALALVLAGHAAPARAQPAEIPTPHTFDTHVPPRRQWNANSGYCGETSFISAGLHFGQYCSQFTARAIASPGVDQSDPASQLLLGVNDTYAAHRMRLSASEFYHQTQQSTHELLDWVKSQTLRGRIVIIGVFNDGIILGEWTGRRDGDPDYDHIVPVLRFGSKRPLAAVRDVALRDDVVTISDNGLYGPFGTPPAYQFDFSFRVRKFRGTRRQANRPRGPVYMLKKRPPSYGIAIEGVMDLDDVTIPVSLTASLDGEPDLGSGSNVPPTPVPLTLTAVVTIPDQSVTYDLYRYDDFDAVPVAGFNAAAANAVESWKIPAGSGATFTVAVETMTDATVVFRAVPATAP
jgi:hypothetical protein